MPNTPAASRTAHSPIAVARVAAVPNAADHSAGNRLIRYGLDLFFAMGIASSQKLAPPAEPARTVCTIGQGPYRTAGRYGWSDRGWGSGYPSPPPPAPGRS